MKCTICKKKKPPNSFSFKNKAQNKRHTHCKTCQRPYGRKHYKTHKAYYIEKAARRGDGLLTKLRQYLEQHPCVDCGESNFVLLDFDHVRGKKVDNVLQMARHGRSEKAIWSEVRKCEIRCVKCHRLRTAKQFGWYYSTPLGII